MLGFADGWVTAAYLLCLGSALLCVVYGLLHWNEADDEPAPAPPSAEDLELEDAAV